MCRTLLCAGVCLGAVGCAMVKQAAVDGATDLFAGAPTFATFSSDDDPELVRDALPFAIKTMEILLRQSPENSDLHLATGRLCIQYAQAFLSEVADYVEESDYEHARQLRGRAVAMFRRGRNYAMVGLASKRTDIEGNLMTDWSGMLPRYGEDDAPYLFWIGAGWAAAIGVNVGDMDGIADLPAIDAVMQRVMILDPDYGNGVVHEFFIVWDGSRSELQGGNVERAEVHFENALEVSRGTSVAPYLALASTVAVTRQDLTRFRELLAQARSVDLGSQPNLLLMNRLGLRRADWMERRIPELFVEAEESE